MVAQLLVQGPAGAHAIDLSETLTTIGRDGDNTVVLESHGVSRRHCQLEKLSEGGHRVVDLESTNGLVVNDRKVNCSHLEPFDQVQVGEFTLTYLDASTDAQKILGLLSPLETVTSAFPITRHPGLKDRLLWLLMTVQELRTEQDLVPLLETLLEELISGIRAESALIMLEQGELARHPLHTVKARNVDPELLLPGVLDPSLPSIRLPLEGDRIGWGTTPLAPEGTTVGIPLRSPQWWEGVDRRRTSAANVQGVLLVAGRRDAFNLTPEELQLLKALGRQLAIVLSNARLHREATVDSLTQLSSRASLERTLEEELTRAQESAQPLGVVILDLDDFKRVNDTLGHLKGDEVLRAFGGRLSLGIRTDDLAGRWGGEEFLVILPATDLLGAKAVGDKIVAKVGSEPLAGVEITVSAGVAVFPIHGQSVQQLMRRADQALYEAKSQGKDRCLVYHDEMTDDGQEFDPSRTLVLEPASTRKRAAEPPSAWLVCDRRADIGLRRGTMTLGRSDVTDVILPSPQVSRLHGKVEVTRDQRIYFSDLSTNGSFLNGERVQDKVELREGDRLLIPPFDFEVLRRNPAQVGLETARGDG